MLVGKVSRQRIEIDALVRLVMKGLKGLQNGSVTVKLHEGQPVFWEVLNNDTWEDIVRAEDSNLQRFCDEAALQIMRQKLYGYFKKRVDFLYGDIHVNVEDGRMKNIQQVKRVNLAINS